MKDNLEIYRDIFLDPISIAEVCIRPADPYTTLFKLFKKEGQSLTELEEMFQLELGRPWVWGLTVPRRGKAGGVRMTDCWNDQNCRLLVIANQPPQPGFEPAT